jgi:hypothetical protein
LFFLNLLALCQTGHAGPTRLLSSADSGLGGS